MIYLSATQWSSTAPLLYAERNIDTKNCDLKSTKLTGIVQMGVNGAGVESGAKTTVLWREQRNGRWPQSRSAAITRPHLLSRHFGVKQTCRLGCISNIFVQCSYRAIARPSAAN